MSEPIILELSGGAYDTGVQHGRHAKDLIAHNLEIYFDRFQREARLEPAEVRARARRYFRVIEDGAPAYAEAMRGVAKGGGLSLDNVAALNARYELIYSQYAAINQERSAHVPAGGCTAFAVTPDASSDGHLWLGQNWDWFPQVRGIVLKARYEDGFTVAAFTEAGIVGGKIGMNSAGLGLVINGLLSNQDDWSRLRTPFHVRTWQILHTRRLADAVRVVTGEARSCSANFLIGQANGAAEVVDIESAPDATCMLAPEGGLLAHANHFMDPAQLAIWQPLAEEKTSTYQRCARMQQMLADGKAARKLDRQDLMALLRDHTGRPDSVCRHPNPVLPEEERVESVVSVLQDLTARRMYVTAGTPCTHEFVPVVV
jgi:isopenicillin-N N-acyltransferase-like protein